MKLHKQSGVAAVELALIMVPMLVLAFGIVEIGRALNYYNGLVKATRSAARYLTTKDLNDTSSPTGVAAITAARNLAVCGLTSGCTPANQLIPGLTTPSTQVAVTTTNDVPTGVGTINLVTVTIGGGGNAAVTFQSFLPYSITSFVYSPVKITMAWSVT